MRIISCIALIVVAAMTADAGDPWFIYNWDDPLYYAHIVVCGEVVELFEIETALSEWQDDPDQSLQGYMHTVLGIRLHVSDVLRGKFDTKDLILYKWHTGLSKYIEPGDRVVFAANYVPESVRFLIRGARGVFWHENGEWIRLSDNKHFSYTELRDEVASMSPANLFEESDLVLCGRLESMERRIASDSTDAKGWVQSYTLSVGNVNKGSVEGPMLEIKMPDEGFYYSEYRAPMPDHIEVGDSVCVFAVKLQFGYYPLGGLNGLLRISEGIVLRDLVRHEVQCSELEKILQQGQPSN